MPFNTLPDWMTPFLAEGDEDDDAEFRWNGTDDMSIFQEARYDVWAEDRMAQEEKKPKKKKK